MRAVAAAPGPGGFALGLRLGSGADAATYVREMAARYGDVVRLRLPSGTGYLLGHPDAIKRVLVSDNRNFVKSRALERAKRILGDGLLTSEGEFHLRQRRLAQPAFHRERIESYAAAMVAFATRTAQRWRANAQFDAGQEMMRLTLSIVGKTLFGADVESDADDVGRALNEVQTLLPLSFVPFSEFFDLVPLPSNVRFWKARAKLDAVIYRIIEQRRGSGGGGDLLSTLLAARDAEGDGSGMSDRQLRDECMTLLLAGHETTARLLTWTWYLLSQHEREEATLHAEIDAVLQDRPPAVGDLAALQVANRIVLESMRLYPPAWLIGRRALSPFEVGGYVLPARSIVLVSPFAVHRDARWYAGPDEFEPDRWLPGRESDRPKFSYIPFGGGPRVCIGEHFARMEAVLVLVTIAQRWRLRLAPGHVARLDPLITLRPRGPMPMTPVPRRT
jgi:cytochrome P450